ncbi:hypothetical protein K8089_13685 [Aequorivita sp. F47161]|uniref:Lipoprotein n=1 Tax=Aequorivita vitellina TaxID=2874475 RepID=A0A9X1QYB1_9FLAO|nr:hypothetical protein [Aequorivita vitellina]MCG2420076.1 hypothetical protein [Aequorivita vitellina]
MKRPVILSILFLLLASCQPSDSGPYYNFSNLDYQSIPEEYRDIGKIFVFKNAENDEVKIKPLYYSLKKEFESGIGFGQPRGDSYYYDNLWIEIDLMSIEIPDKPEGYCESISININKSPYKGLYVKLLIPTYSGQSCTGGGFTEFEPFEGLTQMVINNKTYNKVKIISTNNYFTLYTDSQVDKVYYDMDYGIIGFDDSQNNKEFRLVTD